MESITKQSSIKDKLITAFELNKNSLFGNLQNRELAIASFANQGIPNRKHEEYKYIQVDQVLKGDFCFTINKELSDTEIENVKIFKDAITIVLQNGLLLENASDLTNLPKGLIITSISKAAVKYADIFNKNYSQSVDVTTDSFLALNTALANDGVFINVAKGIAIETPIHIIHISTADENIFINQRNLIVIEENAQAKVIESYVSVDCNSKAFSNSVTEIVVEQSANVDHYKIQEENIAGYSISATHVYQKSKSVFSTNTFTLSGSLVRNNLTLVLDGEYIESHLNGLYLTNGNQVVDNHTLVDHRKPNCNSNELYKGIIEDKSSATFNGKIFVRKDAQKTNAFQSNKNILLSDDGTINTKPQLEIYADDVKCSHGTSTGKLDSDKIFYLRARGLSEARSKKLLMHAFASEVVDLIKVEELRDYIDEKITKRFE